MCLTALEELCTVTVLASKPRGLLMLSYVPYDKSIDNPSHFEAHWCKYRALSLARVKR